MKKRVRVGILGCFGTLIVLAGAGLLLLRWALDPAKVGPIAEARLSQVLGKPVRIGDMGISLFPSPALRATEIVIGESDSDAPSLSIASVRIVPDLSGLFTGKVKSVRVALDGLDCALRRDRRGRWLLPYAPPPAAKQEEAATSPSGPPVEVVSLTLTGGRFWVVDDAPADGGKSREVVTLEDISGECSMSGGTVRIADLKARFQKTRIAGSAEISDQGTSLRFSSPSLEAVDLPQILALAGSAPIEGLSISGKAPLEALLTIPAGNRPMEGSGSFAAEELRLGTLSIQQFQAPFRLENDVVTLKPLAFNAYKGKQAGAVTLSIARAPMGYTVKTSLEGLDVNAALSANTSAKDLLFGTGKVAASVRGAGFDTGALESRLAGDADVAVVNGVIRGVPLLAKINQSLQITGGDQKDTRFDSLTGHFALGGGKAHTEDLILKAGEMSVLMKGDVRFDLIIDFKGRVVFTAAKSQELLQRMGNLKYLVNDRGEVDLPLTVKGLATDPSVSVDLAAAAKQGFKDEVKVKLKNKLKGLFGQ